jgi:hypothetical protein
MIESQSQTWGEDIEEALERLRITCLLRSKYHKNNYFRMLALLKYFRIPTIILSSASSVFNVALLPYMVQENLSLLCCFISLFVGLIGSIELFLQVQKRMETDLLNAKDFYLISIDICKILELDRKNRNCNGRTFLDEKFSSYRHLVETSIITDKDVHENIISLTLVDHFSESEKFDIVNKNISVSKMMDNRFEKPVKSFLENIQFPISTAASRRTSFEKQIPLQTPRMPSSLQTPRMPPSLQTQRTIPPLQIPSRFNNFDKTLNRKASFGAEAFFNDIDKGVDDIEKKIKKEDNINIDVNIP